MDIMYHNVLHGMISIGPPEHTRGREVGGVLVRIKNMQGKFCRGKIVYKSLKWEGEFVRTLADPTHPRVVGRSRWGVDTFNP